jgi:hypothetical protein
MTTVGAKRAVCYLNSGEMLRLFPVEHWLTRFQEFTRHTPTEVVLPAVGYIGPYYDSGVHPPPRTHDAKYLLPDWIRATREKLGDKVTIWASIIVECGFLDNEALWLRNQYQDNLPQVCITNPITQEVLKDIMLEIISMGGIDGIVLDVVDVYPNTGTSGYVGITATCFCDHCVKALRDKGLKEPREAFVGDDGLIRFVLKITKAEGAAHIDPPQDWIDQRDARSLVTLSLAREFVSGDRSTLEAEATRLLKYFDARVKVTAESVRDAFAPARTNNIRTAVVLGSHAADLSQMVTLAALDRVKAADQYWLPDAPDRLALPGEWSALQFLSHRSTYYVNNFFEHVEKAQERAMLGADTFLQILLQTSKKLMGNRLGAGPVYVVGKLPQYEGYVGVPLGADDHLTLVRRLASEVTGTVLPPELLEKFRIANPDKSH